MIRYFCFLMLFSVWVSSHCFPYDFNLPTLKTPQSLEKGLSVFSVKHRFYGALDEDPLDTFLGLDDGANIALSYRYLLSDSQSLRIMRVRENKEYTLSFSQSLAPFMGIDPSLGLHYASFKESDRYRGNGMISLSGTYTNWDHPFYPTLSFLYDHYYKDSNFALGAEYQFQEGFSMIGEYFFSNNEYGDTPSYLIGLKISTFAHRFLFHVHNNSAIGFRRLARGSNSSDLYFGFEIMRILEW